MSYFQGVSRLLAQCSPLLDAIRRAGGHPLIVGGAVRDLLIGIVSSDIDIEVYGLEAGALAEALVPFGSVNAVGRSFGVLKVRLPDGREVDVALPQRGNRNASGQRGILATPDPSMTPQEAAARRDFTWNALALTPEGSLLDFFGGAADLDAGVVRHVSDAFGEDPLRVLRAMRFAARFNMRLARETIEVCRALVPSAGELARERVWGEWWKWSLTPHPSAGLRALEATGWSALYPELIALKDCPQPPNYHPEGCVWTHTQHVCDAAAAIAERDELTVEQRGVLVLAALCHDFGKPATTHFAGGRIRSPGHAAAGGALAAQFLGSVGAHQAIVEQVLPLVREHMVHYSIKPTDRAVRRLAARLAPASMAQWGRLVEADYGGRPPLPPRNPAALYLALARRLAVEDQPPAAVLKGRDLLAAGYAAGPSLGALLQQAYEAQLDGAFTTLEAGLAWLAARQHDQESRA